MNKKELKILELIEVLNPISDIDLIERLLSEIKPNSIVDINNRKEYEHTCRGIRKSIWSTYSKTNVDKFNRIDIVMDYFYNNNLESQEKIRKLISDIHSYVTYDKPEMIYQKVIKTEEFIKAKILINRRKKYETSKQ